jgi:hypothetical protein
MPRGKKNSGESHHGILAAVEQQYLAALRFSRDQIDKRIAALEGQIGGTSVAKLKSSTAAAGGVSGGGKSSGKKKPRNYDLLKARITRPMTIVEILKALDMKPKQEGTIRQVFTNYPGLFKSDGKRPATYTLDASR